MCLNSPSHGLALFEACLAILVKRVQNYYYYLEYANFWAIFSQNAR